MHSEIWKVRIFVKQIYCFRRLMWLNLYSKCAILKIPYILPVFWVASLRESELYYEHFQENLCFHFESGVYWCDDYLDSLT
jgi:hypothetical protein